MSQVVSNTEIAAAHVILSEAKNLSRKALSSQRFFAESILEQSEGLRMTNVTRLFSQTSSEQWANRPIDP